jgi:hypothetical protein
MEIISEAIATDEAEEEKHGDARGDELPQGLSTEAGRRAWLARELAGEREAGSDAEAPKEESAPAHEFDAQRIVARVQGRNGWLREGKRQLDQDRWTAPGPVPRSRSARLWEAGRRLEDDLAAERRGNDAYEQYRATAKGPARSPFE